MIEKCLSKMIYFFLMLKRKLTQKKKIKFEKKNELMEFDMIVIGTGIVMLVIMITIGMYRITNAPIDLMEEMMDWSDKKIETLID